MAVLNVHERILRADDRLWPHGSWPAMRLDPCLSVGAKGGHGPIRYTVSAYEPGVRVSWPLVFRWLHDALAEDALDRAEPACSGTVARPARWSPYVRLLRGVITRLPRR
ncbi:hypothetical protein [Streptomyces sp. NPDC056401]|uniref:hypothetical protein n=1 Tax=Streptomyces sp. NPDC056401 TaxID=3345809 RepID=UPI0035D668C3